MSKKHHTLTDAIKRAIADSGLSVYMVAKESGVPQPVLHRFMADERDIKLGTADKLAKYLKLRLTK
jgi:plasmid maintenance system antidote protein VapI